MKLKHVLSVVTLVGMTIPFTPSVLAADLTGWYGGIGAGQSKFKDADSGNQFESDLAASGITASGTSVDDKDTGWKLFAGYQFHKNFALEGAFIDLGKASLNTTVTAVNGSPVTPMPMSGSFKAKNGFYLDAVGILPIYDNFSFFGKVGAYSIDAELSASALGATASNSERKSDLTYGLGLNYNITKNVGIRGEWERFRKVGDTNKTGQTDIDLLSIGVVYKF